MRPQSSRTTSLRLCFHIGFCASLFLPLFLSSCRHAGSSERLAPPDGRVAVDQGDAGESEGATQLNSAVTAARTDFDPLAPIRLDLDASPIAEAWKVGATTLVIREVKNSVCEPALEAGICLDDEVWQIERAARKVSRRVCRCGVSSEKSKTLTQQDFQELEQSIQALSVALNPAPCVGDAPDVKIEVTALSGETSNYAVNYGQCASGMTPRIDLKSFEALNARLGQLGFP